MASTAVVLKLIKMVVGKVGLLRECFDAHTIEGVFSSFRRRSTSLATWLSSQRNSAAFRLNAVHQESTAFLVRSALKYLRSVDSESPQPAEGHDKINNTFQKKKLRF